MPKKKLFHIILFCIIIALFIYFLGFYGGNRGSGYKDGITYSKPDSFGSIAVPTEKSPYNQKWAHAAKSGSGPVWKEMLLKVASRKSEREKLSEVQAVVNHSIGWGTDMSLWGEDDYWSSPNETLKKGCGDCEDYAILKMMILREAGFPQNKLYLVIGLDTAAQQAHAVLVAKSEGRFWVLDQRTDAVIADDKYDFFAPVISMSDAQSWVHGYKLLGA